MALQDVLYPNCSEIVLGLRIENTEELRMAFSDCVQNGGKWIVNITGMGLIEENSVEEDLPGKVIDLRKNGQISEDIKSKMVEIEYYVNLDINELEWKKGITLGPMIEKTLLGIETPLVYCQTKGMGCIIKIFKIDELFFDFFSDYEKVTDLSSGRFWAFQESTKENSPILKVETGDCSYEDFPYFKDLMQHLSKKMLKYLSGDDGGDLNPFLHWSLGEFPDLFFENRSYPKMYIGIDIAVFRLRDGKRDRLKRLFRDMRRADYYIYRQQQTTLINIRTPAQISDYIDNIKTIKKEGNWELIAEFMISKNPDIKKFNSNADIFKLYVCSDNLQKKNDFLDAGLIFVCSQDTQLAEGWGFKDYDRLGNRWKFRDDPMLNSDEDPPKGLGWMQKLFNKIPSVIHVDERVEIIVAHSKEITWGGV